MVLFVMFQTCRRIDFEDRAQRLRVTPGGQEQGRRRAGVWLRGMNRGFARVSASKGATTFARPVTALCI
jgi:hypothetical protein